MNIISNFNNVSHELKAHLLCFNEYVKNFTQLAGCYEDGYDYELRDQLFNEESCEFVAANLDKDRVEELDAILDMCYILVGSIDLFESLQDFSRGEVDSFHDKAGMIQEAILRWVHG